LAEPDKFAAVARELSNCPSGQQGGNLGQIARGDTVPEFEQAIFRLGANAILRHLVKTAN
jgi:peptidyl-prolyl cis-trans isomerase C